MRGRLPVQKQLLFRVQQVMKHLLPDSQLTATVLSFMLGLKLGS